MFARLASVPLACQASRVLHNPRSPWWFISGSARMRSGVWSPGFRGMGQMAPWELPGWGLQVAHLFNTVRENDSPLVMPPAPLTARISPHTQLH